MRRVVAIVDGEHYPPVVRAALEEIDDLVVAAVLIGGTEKLRGDGETYGVPLEPSIEAAVELHRPDVVLDLSDEPVLGPRERFALASRVLALGIPYEGPDFRFDPPIAEPVGIPTLAVIGTGKRVGKTAVTGHVARRLAATRRIVVVAMGRGGPPEPETVLVAPTVEALLDLSRDGRHAASDHLETAIAAGVPTVGSRRCGGGLAGSVAVSNVLEGVSVAIGLGPDLVVLDGSGAALPPVDAGRRLLVTSAAQPIEVAAGYLNAYRARIADLVVVTMAEPDAPHAELRDALQAHIRPGTPVIRAVLRPRPLEPVSGERVAFFCTAPESQHGRLAAHLEDAHGARVTHVSGSLADRAAPAGRALAHRRRRLRRRAQGGGRRRRRRGGEPTGRPRRRRRQRRRAAPGRAGSRCRAPASRRGGGGARPRGRPVSERRYLAPLPLGGEEGPPWSKGLMSRALAATGLTVTRAYELARRADADMAERGTDRLDLDRLAELAAEVLGEAEGSRTMRRLRHLHALRQLDVPIILLVGGATGTGKSTIATEAAHRLGITRVTSTDFIRQTMRAFFSRAFMPSVHYSSFEAGLALTKAEEDEAGDARLLGFLDQTRNVLVGVEAAIDRSLAEGWSMVLEGVHLVPGMVDLHRGTRSSSSA